MGRQCEMETSWHIFGANNGGGSHTIVYNECTIPYFLSFLLYYVAAPLFNVYSNLVRFHYEPAKYVRIKENGFLATRGWLFEKKNHTKFIA